MCGVCGANVSTILSGPAPQAPPKWLEMQGESDGESVFLTKLEPRIQGGVVQLNEEEVYPWLLTI
jgi:hypothetical protein